MIIRWYGTASIEIESNGKRLLFDPFVPLHGSKVPVALPDFDGYDAILVTHGHFDHILSLPDIYLRNPNITIYCTKTPYGTLIHKGIPDKNLILIDYDQELVINGMHIATYHGKHAILPTASLEQIVGVFRRKPLSNLKLIGKENRICKENDETVLYKIDVEGKQILVMGSLNLRADVAYPSECDLMILPYNGWGDNYEPAVNVIERLAPKHILLDHYDDTFPPLTSYIDLKPVIKHYGERVRALETGKDFVI